MFVLLAGWRDKANRGPLAIRDFITSANPGVISKPSKAGEGREVTAMMAFLKLALKGITGENIQKDVQAQTNASNAEKDGCGVVAATSQIYLDATVLEARELIRRNTTTTIAKMPIILEIDARGMFQQTKRSRSIKEMLKIPRLARLFVGALLMYSTANTVRYYHTCSEEVDERTVLEGGLIGDAVIQLVSQVAIAEDTAAVQKLMHDRGIYVSITIIADNVVLAGTVEDVIQAAHAFDTLENGHYTFDEKKFMRTLDLPPHMHDDDDLDDAMMPGNGMLQTRLQQVYKKILPEQYHAGWDKATVETQAMKHLGIPVGTDRGVFQMLGVRAAEFENTCKFLANVHNANPADVDALVMGTLDAQVRHIVAAVPTHLTEDFARRIDAAVVDLYTSFYNRAPAGFSSEPTDIFFSPEQKEMLFLKADRTTAGKGLQSMSQLRDAQVYVATVKGVINMAKKKRLPMKAKIVLHIGGTMREQIQIALKVAHKRTTKINKARIAAKVPEDATEFLKSRTTATKTAKILSTLQQTDKARRFNAGAVRYKGGGPLLRLYEAQSARLDGYGAEKPLKNARSRKLTTVTRQGWTVTFATMMGLPIPGFQHLDGMTCDCRGEHAEVDINHVFACGKYGKSHVHRAVNHAMGTAIALFGGDVAQFHRFEPRGKDYYQAGGGQRTRPGSYGNGSTNVCRCVSSSGQHQNQKKRISCKTSRGKPTKNTVGTYKSCTEGKSSGQA